MSVQLALCVGTLCALACVLTLTTVHLGTNRRLSVITELQPRGQERDATHQNLTVFQSARRALLNTSYVTPRNSAKQGAVQGAGVPNMCFCNDVPATPLSPVVGSNPITMTIQHKWVDTIEDEQLCGLSAMLLLPKRRLQSRTARTAHFMHVECRRREVKCVRRFKLFCLRQILFICGTI